MEDAKFEVYKAAAELLEENGYEAHAREDYSGRGMGGDTCAAIVTDAPGTVVGMVIALCLPDYNDALEWLPKRSDGMGRDCLVWY